MLCCLQQFYSYRDIYLDRAEPKEKTISVLIFQQNVMAEIKQCQWTTHSFTCLHRRLEESSVVFPLVCTLAMCSVLAEVSETSSISPFLGIHFSLLDFPVTNRVLFSSL